VGKAVVIVFSYWTNAWFALGVLRVFTPFLRRPAVKIGWLT